MRWLLAHALLSASFCNLQEALERAALVPSALRAALCALQPAAGGDAALEPAHWRVIAAGLASGPRAALVLDALFDATAAIYAMACARIPTTRLSFPLCCSSKHTPTLVGGDSAWFWGSCRAMTSSVSV